MSLMPRQLSQPPEGTPSRRALRVGSPAREGVQVKTAIIAMVLVASISCTTKAPPTVRAVHEFDLVSGGGLPGTSMEDLVPCLKGKHEGRTFLLLSDRDSATCPVVGGKVGVHFLDGECTLLEGAQRCGRGYPLAVLGSRGEYRRVDPKVVTDETEKAALLQAIVQGKVVDAATERWRGALSDVAYEAVVVDALTWPGLDGAPTLVRLGARGEVTEGPWGAIAHGVAGTMVGPYTLAAPTGFLLDGRSYLSVQVADCHHCGNVGTEVHAVEDGKLRRVLESYANAN